MIEFHEACRIRDPSNLILLLRATDRLPCLLRHCAPKLVRSLSTVNFEGILGTDRKLAFLKYQPINIRKSVVQSGIQVLVEEGPGKEQQGGEDRVAPGVEALGRAPATQAQDRQSVAVGEQREQDQPGFPARGAAPPQGISRYSGTPLRPWSAACPRARSARPRPRPGRR